MVSLKILNRKMMGGRKDQSPNEGPTTQRCQRAPGPTLMQVRRTGTDDLRGERTRIEDVRQSLLTETEIDEEIEAQTETEIEEGIEAPIETEIGGEEIMALTDMGIEEETRNLRDQDARAMKAGGGAAMSKIPRKLRASHRLQDPAEGLQQGAATPMAVMRMVMDPKRHPQPRLRRSASCCELRLIETDDMEETATSPASGR